MQQVAAIGRPQGLAVGALAAAATGRRGFGHHGAVNLAPHRRRHSPGFADMDDPTLLDAVGRGLDGAAEVFVRRFQSKVCGVAYSVVGPRGDVEDIAQQAFVKAWRAASTFDANRGTVAAWVCRIARNTALDSVRGRRPSPLEDEALIARCDAASRSADPAAEVDARAEVNLVRAQLSGLPEEQRRALLLATVGSRTMAEIAQLENVPVPTVKTRIRLAVRKIRRALDEEDGHE
jgi:RNA polymerase sigma factor (sigma-70 family)